MTGRSAGSSEPVARNVLSEQVKDRILQWILEGHLAPGSRIIETRVAKELGVSQAPVREALRDLTTLGVVEMKPYRGASVRQPTKTDLVEVVEVRGELEALAAKTAASRVTEECLAELRKLIAEMNVLREAGDAQAHAHKNITFRETVLRASGNRTLLRTWSMLEPYASTYVTAMVPGMDLIWLDARHQDILEALEARDPDRAAETMRQHAREAESVVMQMDDSAFASGDPVSTEL